MQTWSRAAGVLGTSIPQPGAWGCGSWPCQVEFSPSQAPQGWAAGELWEGHPQRPSCCWSCLATFTAYSFGFNSSLFFSLVTFIPTKSAQQKTRERSTPSLPMAHLRCKCTSHAWKKAAKLTAEKPEIVGRKWQILTYCIRDEEVVAQEAIVQHGGDEPLQPGVAPVGAQGAHLDKQREVTGSGETTQTLQGA